jgi:hypothetical protein
VAHPAAGVEAGGELEPDVEAAELLAGQPGRRDQGLQPGHLAGLEPAEAEVGERPVLADERDDVGDRAEGGQGGGVDEEVAERAVDLGPAGHRQPDAPGQLERHAGPAQGGVAVRRPPVGSRGWTTA